MKLIKGFIAMAAFAAIFVVPSMASAAPELTCPTGTNCPSGQLIEAENVAHPGSGISSITKMTTGLGNIECATATLTGKLLTNSGTHIEGEITTAEFKGTPSNHATAHCLAPGGTAVVTPSHTTNDPIDNGLASLPWCITANTLDDKFTVTGGECGKPRALTFDLHTSVAGTCTYEKASVTGEYTTHPSDAILWIKEQEFKKNTGSVFCPPSGKLDMAFTMRVDTPGNTNPVYIS